MGREENILIFEDTVNKYKTDSCLKESIIESITNTEIYLENTELNLNNLSQSSIVTEVKVTKDRSFEAARKLVEDGYSSVCVHNFASATNPGGGVTKGSTAQEECLCRISTLYETLIQKECINKFYNPHKKQSVVHNDDCIYTPKVTVFKTDTNKPILMDKKDWYNVNVITCAAPNLRIMPNNRYNSHESKEKIKVTDRELLEIHKKRLQRIIDIAYMKGNECLVLGAFGCGAFQNNPNVVARATKEVINENKGKFKKFVVAVYCTERDMTNYTVFNRMI